MSQSVSQSVIFSFFFYCKYYYGVFFFFFYKELMHLFRIDAWFWCIFSELMHDFNGIFWHLSFQICQQIGSTTKLAKCISVRKWGKNQDITEITQSLMGIICKSYGIISFVIHWTTCNGFVGLTQIGSYHSSVNHNGICRKMYEVCRMYVTAPSLYCNLATKLECFKWQRFVL